MEDNPNSLVVDIPDKKLLIWHNVFWVGFIIYALSYSISHTEKISYMYIDILQVIGLSSLIAATGFLIKPRIDNPYLRYTFFLFCFWTLFVIVRGFQFNYIFIKGMLFNSREGIFLHFVPLTMLFFYNLSYIRKVFNVIIILAIGFLFYDMLFIKQLVHPFNSVASQSIIESFTQDLSFASGFIVLTFVYHTRRRTLIALFVLILTFLLAVLRARRGLIFISFSMLIFSYIIYQIANKGKVINIVLSILLICLLSYVAIKVYFDHRTDTFSLITERFQDDSRGAVLQYFYMDMKTQDWIIGKGISGRYYCPGIGEGEGVVSVYRKVIEAGYLQTILRGGLISLVLYLLIAIPAIIKGVFYSKNMLSKAAGIWIFILLLYSYPGTMTTFTLHYILVWISIGICYSARIRNMSDYSVKEAIYGHQV
jgi:hypothetical protein